MNNQRRRQIEKITQKLEEAIDAIEALKNVEEEYYRNSSEDIKCGEQGGAMQEIINSLEYASSDISDAIDFLNSTTG